MKLIRSIFMLLLFAGCCPPQNYLTPITYESLLKIPRQWEAPTLYVRLPENVKEGDPSIALATALCKEFAIRVYDAFDGQVYVPKFVICNPSVISERQEGVCNLFVTGSTLYRNEAYVGRPPLHPGRFYCTIPSDPNWVGWCAGTMLHEWMHTFIGVGDEYKHAGEPGSDMTTSCPRDPLTEQHLKDNACVMYLSRTRKELCRPENHNPDTDQGKESCYSYAARILLENRLALIRVPSKTIVGPFDPPTPKIEIRLK